LVLATVLAVLGVSSVAAGQGFPTNTFIIVKQVEGPVPEGVTFSVDAECFNPTIPDRILHRTFTYDATGAATSENSLTIFAGMIAS